MGRDGKMKARRDAKYWLTTQWAHPLDGSLPYYVFLKPKYQCLKRAVQDGDGVLFYELGRRAPSWAFANPPKGRQAIVAVAVVGAPFRKRSGLPPENPFTLEAVCTQRSGRGTVPRAKVNAILSYKPNYTFFGYGGGSGLAEINLPEFQQLVNLLLA